MDGVESENLSEADLNEFLGLPEGFTLGEGDSGPEDGGEDEVEAERKRRAIAATPLFALSEVERYVLESNEEKLLEIKEKATAKMAEQGEVFERDKELAKLQMEVLDMAYHLAGGRFLDCLKSPAVEGVISEESLSKIHPVSRIKNRMARFLHERILKHIESGLGNCIGRKTFRDPQIASPDEHLNQGALRATACMFLGAACLSAFIQANWTGPPLKVNEDLYPLPFVKGIFDPQTSGDSNYVSTALNNLDADVRATKAVTGKEFQREEIDRFPQLHARCALLLGANGEDVYRDSRFLHYLHVARVILRVVSNPTLSPAAVDPVDMLVEAREEVEDEDGNGDDQNSFMGRKPQEEVAAKVRSAVVHLLSAGWWAARSATIHQESLEAKNAAAPSLRQEVERGFEQSLSAFRLQELGPDFQARFWLERGVSFHEFGRAEDAKNAFSRAQDLAKLNVKLSGALGKRTKFQKHEKAQLVLLAASESTQAPEELNEEPKKEPKAVNHDEQASETASPGRNRVLGIPKIALEEIDPETPLHERIQLNKEADSKEATMRRGSLSLLDQCILLGLCMDVKNSYAMEALTAEEMMAYVERVVQSPNNWMLYSTALLIKSQLEYEKTKTKERAILQMQVLVDQQSDRLTALQPCQKDIDNAASPRERFEWLHALAWPAIWDLKRGLAERYLEVGAAGSALEIFQQVRLWEEAVDCLVVMDRRTRAEELINSRLEVQPTANLYTVMGNLKQDPDWYRKAWEFSNKRYARAKRLWAVNAYGRGEMRECIEHLREALEINPLFPESWFRLGGAAMRIKDWRTAKTAFAHVTRQDPENGDAWANLSTVLEQLKDFRAALNAISDAVRRSRRNWKIWENYVMLAVRMKQWGMAIDGLRNLIDVKLSGAASTDIVDIPSLLMVVDAIITMKDKVENGSSVGIVGDHHLDDGFAIDPNFLQSLENQLLELFAKMRQKCKSEPNMWKVMSIYYDSVSDHENARDCLTRRIRALMNANEDWERDAEKTQSILSVILDFHQRCSQQISDDPENAKAIADEAKGILTTVLHHLEKNADLDENVANPLRIALSEYSK